MGNTDVNAQPHQMLNYTKNHNFVEKYCVGRIVYIAVVFHWETLGQKNTKFGKVFFPKVLSRNMVICF